ncbi:hypothetical protein SAMD00019534_077440 [Acytostelium subglobosum LB1]|uniref:hypothetical protein n=1 Tax=Acytostelium subglobosum LB1 TaxID=1410327 RepID=UPI00064498D1|nr:hypothetical protein SAMD00019534_077440 [Acytostelium subglobosum LB1]GAM24569.1 hypothetical protein SAMD00019534_077440 [Acytostelium subglobosum LB1]|eukprot:XP_012752238.1 hypothetical protein SAMD00019534_077440 [Acytostelium subglobosum LB1]
MLKYLIDTGFFNVGYLLEESESVANYLYSTRSSSTINFVLDENNFPKQLVNRIKACATKSESPTNILMTGDTTLIDLLIGRTTDLSHIADSKFDILPNATPTQQLEHIERLKNHKLLQVDTPRTQELSQLEQSLGISTTRANVILSSHIEKELIDIGDESRMIFAKLAARQMCKDYVKQTYIKTGDCLLIPYLNELWGYDSNLLNIIVKHGTVTQAKVQVGYWIEYLPRNNLSRFPSSPCNGQLFDFFAKCDNHSNGLQVVRYLNDKSFISTRFDDGSNTPLFLGDMDCINFLLSKNNRIFPWLTHLNIVDLDLCIYVLQTQCSYISDQWAYLVALAAVSIRDIPLIHRLISLRPGIFKKSGLLMLAYSLGGDLSPRLEKSLAKISSLFHWRRIGDFSNIDVFEGAYKHLTSGADRDELLLNMIERAVYLNRIETWTVGGTGWNSS